MNVTGKVDLSRYNAALQAWQAWVNKAAVITLKDEARLLFERIITGPKGSSGGRGIATPPGTRSQGEAALKRDVMRAVKVLRPEHFDDPSIARAIRNEPYNVLQAMAEKGAFGPRLRHAKFSWFLPWHHKEQRNRRGIVPMKRNYLRATTDLVTVTGYIRNLQNMVGQAKGGWVNALEKCGGRAANWISRHKKAGVDQSKFEGDDLKASGINLSAWASIGDEDRIVSQAMAGRAQALEAKLKHAVEAYAQKRGVL